MTKPVLYRIRNNSHCWSNANIIPARFWKRLAVTAEELQKYLSEGWTREKNNTYDYQFGSEARNFDIQ